MPRHSGGKVTQAFDGGLFKLHMNGLTFHLDQYYKLYFMVAITILLNG